jgi:dipeptidyl aminopeptidase/acylaminoacyl peptidase
VVALSVTLAVPSVAAAQGTPADYARAEKLRTTYESLVADIAGPPTAIGNTHRFWYRKMVRGAEQFVAVDADTQQRQPAFDHEKIAASLSTAAGTPYKATALPFNTLAFTADGSAFTVNVDGSPYRCTVADATCRKLDTPLRAGAGLGVGRRRQDEGPRVSPDGKWEALINNFNIAVRAAGTGTATRLSTDGSEGNAYELSSIAWSPDSKKIAAYRVKPGYRRQVHYVESSPEDQLQPKHTSILYAKPGDVLDVEQPVLFLLDSKRQIVVGNALFPNAYAMSALEWRKDSHAFTFEYNQRGHQIYRVVEVDGTTGTARAVISEEPKTFFTYRTANGGLADSGKQFRFDVDDGKEIVWMSERDGWNHLYLYDGVTGAVKNQITRGNWVVRGVQHVDPAMRQIWFSAGGMYPGKDPYFANYYRINFDGSGLTRLTGADANHALAYTSDMKYYVDTYSRIDMPPAMELRRTGDNGLVTTLERGEITELVKAGWKPPEVFVAKGRDGTTDIWGIIIRPSRFDPSKKYPVIENIYAGPQGSFVPKSFFAYNQMQSQAELGFVVVQIDGMGTSNRSKAFHDAAWKNLGDAGFPDRILWHKAAAAKYPFYDITRVGIYGGSAGGQNALGGLLFHPELYKAGIAYAGCHDNRMDKIWWNEQWMGWPLGPQYSASSNVDNAYRLQGDLLLVVGELDTNVDPSSTMQVVNQLIRHNKNFDLLVVPGANHPAGRGNDPTAPYGDHKRFDFFVQHLLGVTPPPWNRTSTPSTDNVPQR